MNNTVYVGSGTPRAFHFQENARRALIVNNIFYIESTTFDGTYAQFDDYTQDMIDSVVWENNLYQRTGIIPASFPFAETGQTVGDPVFANPGGLTAEDYIPSATPLVTNQGMTIEKLPGDSLGLEVGLAVTEDYFGNPIVGLPDMGAVEIGDTPAPLPDASFDSIPTALGPNSVSMTSVQGPYDTEYYFTETSGNFGGTDSGWQSDPTYTDDALLPNTPYSYTVTLRDTTDTAGTASTVSEVTTPTVQFSTSEPLLSEDFATDPDPSNQSSPYPFSTWFVAYDPEDISSSVASSNGQLRIGWGYDAIMVLYVTDVTFDLDSDYQFSGDWEIENVLDVHQGIVVGIGEFNPSTGALVSRVKEIAIGELTSPVIGQSDTFSLGLTASELATVGVSAGNRIGVFFDHPGGFTPNRNDVYLVDNLVLELANVIVDTDGDGIPDADEPGLGLDPENPEDGALDGDNDGFTNAEEFLMNTDPTDPGSRLAPLTEVVGGQLELRVPQSLIHAQRWYILDESTDLTHWTTTQAFRGGDVTGDLIFSIPTTHSKGFGRVRVEWE